MKARIKSLTCQQEKEITRVVREQVSSAMQDIQLQLDMLWLNVVRKHGNHRAEWLKELYREYFKERAEFIEFYQSDGYDGMVEYASQLELEGVGCNVPEWYKEFGEPRVSYRISKGETQQLRESKERIKTSG